MSLNHADIAGLMKGIAPAIRDYTQEGIDLVLKRLKVMEERLEALERRPAAKYCGVWADGRKYAEASIVTHSGSLWIAHVETAAKPGGGDWQLIVKSGGGR